MFREGGWSEIVLNSWCFTRKRKNSFYLYGDGDDVAIREEIDRRFAINNTDEEAKSISNFGDLFDNVMSKIDLENGLEENNAVAILPSADQESKAAEPGVQAMAAEGLEGLTVEHQHGYAQAALPARRNQISRGVEEDGKSP